MESSRIRPEGGQWLAVITTAVLAGILTLQILPADAGSGVERFSQDMFCGPSDLLDAEPYVPLREPTAEPHRQNFFAEGVPMYIEFINSHGIRDDPFEAEKPENTTRILVLGDSHTFGLGLNASQRYTEKTERALNERFERRIQVINAGQNGAGMKDYYLYLLNHGIAYDPDIVVVAFYQLDAIPRERHDRWVRAVMDTHNKSSPKAVITDEDAFAAVDQKKERFKDRLTWRTSDIRVYGNMIRALALRHNATPLYYYIKHSPPRYMRRPVQINETLHRSALDAWERLCGIQLFHAPNSLEGANGHTAPRYRLPDGSHYNAAGNTLLAHRLTAELTDYLNRTETP